VFSGRNEYRRMRADTLRVAPLNAARTAQRAIPTKQSCARHF
jgi:hypothetical protein